MDPGGGTEWDMIDVEGRQCIVPGALCGELTRIERAVVGWMRVTRGSSWSPGEIEWWLGSVKDGRDLAAVNGSVALVVDAENGVVGL